MVAHGRNGLTKLQWDIFMTIVIENRELTNGELVSLTCKDTSVINRNIVLLEDMGLVEVGLKKRAKTLRGPRRVQVVGLPDELDGSMNVREFFCKIRAKMQP